jgi:hypothetical protein
MHNTGNQKSCFIRKVFMTRPKETAEAIHKMYELTYTLPSSKDEKKKLLKMDLEQQLLYDVIHK